MRSRLILAFVALTVVLLVVFGIPLRGFVERVERERLITSLERDAFILAGHAKETLNPSSSATLPSLDPFIAEHSTQTDSRVVVTNSDGIVVATNDSSLRVGSDFTNRPEVLTALNGLPAVGERVSESLGEKLVFVAVPVFLGDDVLGVVRFSNPQSVITQEVRESLVGIAIAGLFTILAGIALAIPVALGIARPLVRLRRNADTLARGNFDTVAEENTGPREVRELASAFNSMSQRLYSMMESQRQFNGVVSHQLRTPLTALRLRLEFVQQKLGDGNVDLIDAVEASNDELDRLQDIIEQLLNLSRIEAGVVPRVDIDVSEVIRQRIEMWTPLAEERGVAIVADVASGLHCEMIQGGLDQIVDNYVDNALGVSSEGATITIHARRVTHKVIVEVIDDGPGLTEKEKIEAFDRFWRSASSQNVSGTGLGLAIVRQLAIASGAKAFFTDRPDARPGLRAVIECVAK